jgi:phosphate transport system substrate-binding protein
VSVAPKAPSAQPDPGKDNVNIKVNGSDTMVNLGQAWSEEFNKKFPNVKIEVSGGGSGTGIAAIIDGQTQLCNSSREMKADEKKKFVEKNPGKELKEFIVGTDALAVYVHKDNPIEAISIEELGEVYGDGGKITKWSELTGDKKEEKKK